MTLAELLAKKKEAEERRALNANEMHRLANDTDKPFDSTAKEKFEASKQEVEQCSAQMEVLDVQIKDANKERIQEESNTRSGRGVRGAPTLNQLLHDYMGWRYGKCLR